MLKLLREPIRSWALRVRTAWRLANELEVAMTAEQQQRLARDTGVGARAVGTPAVILFGLLFVIGTVVLLYGVWLQWPPAPTPVTGGGLEFQNYDGLVKEWNVEQKVLLLIALLGALGAMGYVLRSFAKYVGERNLVWSWIALYLLTPFLAAVVSTASYILLRAGLLGTSAAAAGGNDTVGNTWGFAAVAILVGLFAAQASSKLKQVFEALFTAQPAGGEAAGTAPPEPE